LFKKVALNQGMYFGINFDIKIYHYYLLNLLKLLLALII